MTTSKISLYFDEKSKIYKKLNYKIIDKVFKTLINTYEKDGQVFLMANGGSSSIAEGFAVDLRTHPFVNDDKSITTSKRRIKVECLTESSGCLTGISNDIGFDYVFEEQLKNHMRSRLKNKNDLLIVFSGSGNSQNIINAINYSKKYVTYFTQLTLKSVTQKKRADILKELLKNVSYYFSLLFNILRLVIEKREINSGNQNG